MLPSFARNNSPRRPSSASKERRCSKSVDQSCVRSKVGTVATVVWMWVGSVDKCLKLQPAGMGKKKNGESKTRHKRPSTNSTASAHVSRSLTNLDDWLEIFLNKEWTCTEFRFENNFLAASNLLPGTSLMTSFLESVKVPDMK